MKRVEEVLAWFESLYVNDSIYIYGGNAQVITPELCNTLFRNYGNSTYDRAYFDAKLVEGYGHIGADCSGAFYPLSGKDNTAQGYYDLCPDRGLIGRMDRDKPCMVFKGKSDKSITHIGMYMGDGNVIEMKSSKENCVKAPLDGHGWKYYGIPDWIDYSGEKPVPQTASIDGVKGVDLSSNQEIVEFPTLKHYGYEFVILRTILKSGAVDSKYGQYLKEALSNGLKVGVYIYSYDMSQTDAITSAEKMDALLTGYSGIPVFYDLEYKAQLEKIGREGVSEVAWAFIRKMEQLHRPVYIYCSLDWYNNVLNKSLRPYIAWIARYGKNTGTLNNAYKPNVGERIWQYTSKGLVPGVTDYVDVNVCYDMSLFDGQGSSVPDPAPKQDYTLQSINVLGRVTASSLNIREEPNTECQILGVYRNGEIIPLFALSSNGWYKTDKGFVSAKFVKYLQGRVVKCNSLNVRKYSNTTAERITTIPRGTIFIIMNRQNDWYNILLADNTVGWVSGKYVELL